MQCKSEKLSLFVSELVSFLEKEWVLDAYKLAKQFSRHTSINAEVSTEGYFFELFQLGCKASGTYDQNNYMMEALYQVLLHANTSGDEPGL